MTLAQHHTQTLDSPRSRRVSEKNRIAKGDNALDKISCAAALYGVIFFASLFWSAVLLMLSFLQKRKDYVRREGRGGRSSSPQLIYRPFVMLNLVGSQPHSFQAS